MKFDLREKYREMPAAVKTSLWFTICQFLQRGISLITVPVFTRLLTTEEYGICNIYFTWFDVFLLFTSLKIPYEGLNNGLIRYEEKKDAYTSSVLGLILVMTAAGAGVYLLFRSWIDRLTGLGGFLMALMFVQLMFHPPLMLWTNRERFDFRYRRPAAVTIASTLLNLAVTVAAVVRTEYKAQARIIGSMSVQTVSGIVLAAVLFYRGRTFYKKEYWSFALRFNLPLIFYYVSQVILNQSDRILINYFQGSGKAAVYSVAYSAATLMLLVLSAVNGSFHPWMYKKLKAGDFQAVGQTATVLCLLAGVVTFAVSALAPELVRVLATEEYMEAIWIIAPVSASVFFIFLYMVFANVEMYCNANRGISVISVACSLLNIVLNLIFLPVFGYLAAGWTTLFSYLVLTALHYLLMKRACRASGLPGDIFQKLRLAVISGGVVLLAFAAMALYRLPYIRYPVLLAAAAVLLWLFWRRRKEEEHGATDEEPRAGGRDSHRIL